VFTHHKEEMKFLQTRALLLILVMLLVLAVPVAATTEKSCPEEVIVPFAMAGTQ
jgi:hypothetical protein